MAVMFFDRLRLRLFKDALFPQEIIDARTHVLLTHHCNSARTSHKPVPSGRPKRHPHFRLWLSVPFHGERFQKTHRHQTRPVRRQRVKDILRSCETWPHSSVGNLRAAGDPRRGPLVVSNGTVLDGQNKHHASLFPDLADNPIIANAITPQAAELMAQGLPEAARVFLRGNAGVHVVDNFPLHCPVKGL
jgi:hypothetical protein